MTKEEKKAIEELKTKHILENIKCSTEKFMKKDIHIDNICISRERWEKILYHLKKVEKDYIPKSKIKEKIKNIDEQIEKIKFYGYSGITETPDLKFHKKILQDLLESDYPFVPYNIENKSRSELEEEIKELEQEFMKKDFHIAKQINTESEE